MGSSARIAFLVALITLAAQLPVGMGALADDHDRNSWGDRDHHGDHGVHGAPGPIAGAGLPFLAVGYGVYWLARRRRKTQ
jgi:hypothetical protein